MKSLFLLHNWLWFDNSVCANHKSNFHQPRLVFIDRSSWSCLWHMSTIVHSLNPNYHCNASQLSHATHASFAQLFGAPFKLCVYFHQRHSFLQPAHWKTDKIYFMGKSTESGCALNWKCLKSLLLAITSLELPTIINLMLNITRVKSTIHLQAVQDIYQHWNRVAAEHT